MNDTVTVTEIDATRVAQNYIALWNESDAARRTAMLASQWTDDALYVDPLMRGRGPAEISALVGAVHARFPGFRFALKGTAQGHGENLRFSWALGAPGAESLVEGTDFVWMDEGRVGKVTGFLDKVPA